LPGTDLQQKLIEAAITALSQTPLTLVLFIMLSRVYAEYVKQVEWIRAQLEKLIQASSDSNREKMEAIARSLEAHRN
jgi:hypothetical protein